MENEFLNLNLKNLDTDDVLVSAIITLAEILDEKGIASRDEFLEKFQNNVVELARERESGN